MDTIEGQKSIRFDLSGDLLKQKFKEENITYDTTIAYDWLKNPFEGLGYIHEQDNIYKTTENRKDLEVIRDLIHF